MGSIHTFLVAKPLIKVLHTGGKTNRVYIWKGPISSHCWFFTDLGYRLSENLLKAIISPKCAKLHIYKLLWSLGQAPLPLAQSLQAWIRQPRAREAHGFIQGGVDCGCLPAIFLSANWALLLLPQLQGDDPFLSSHSNSILLASDCLRNVHNSILTKEVKSLPGASSKRNQKTYFWWDAMNCSCKLMVARLKEAVILRAG